MSNKMMISYGKISIIVPSYNNGVYIKDCLDSILNQSYENWELIFVDDGSTDDTKSIVKTNYLYDHRIKYIYKENGGLSSARNKGMEIASGEYLFFLDSDDYLNSDALLNLIRSASENDIVIGRYQFVFEDGSKIIQSKTRENCYLGNAMNSFDVFEYFFNPAYGINACNKLYRKSIVDNSGIIFQPNKDIFAEDLLFNAKLLPSIGKISILDDITYYYRQNNASITHTYKVDLSKRYANLVNDYNKIVESRDDLTLYMICNAINCISSQEKNISSIKNEITIFKGNIDNTVFANKWLKYIKRVKGAYVIDYFISTFFLKYGVILLAFYQFFKNQMRKGYVKK